MAFRALRIRQPNAGVGGNEIEQRFDGFVQGLVPDIRHHDGTCHLVDTQLAYRVKLANGIHFISKKLDPVRVVEGVREHVHNAPAYGILSRFVNEIHFVKTVFDENFIKKVHRIPFSHSEGKSLL